MSDLYDDDIVEWSERQADLLRRRAAGKLVNDADNALHVLGDLKKRGVSRHMIDLGGDVTGNGISKLVCTILSAVAEAERDRTRERISEVKADQRKRGRFLGGSVPFGWGATKRAGWCPRPVSKLPSAGCGRCGMMGCRSVPSGTAWPWKASGCRTWA